MRIRKKFLLMIFLFSFFVISPNSVFAALSAKEEAALKAELSRIEAEAKQLEETLQKQKNESATISRDVNVLSNQIKQAELAIQKKNLEIKNLKSTIELKEKTINELDSEIEKGKLTLAQLIKKTNQMDVTSLPEIILGNENLSTFFSDMDAYNMIQNQLKKQFDDIRETQRKTEEEKKSLEGKKNATLDAQDVIVQEKKTVAVKKQEKDYLLTASKKSEATYASILQEKLAKAASIRATLFPLRDSEGIPFGEILKYADKASQITGVRTALILGILKQETNLGQVDGSCLIVDLKSGKTRGINSGKIFENGIHPTRDLPIIQTLLKNLGRDPLKTRVSCPWGSGYGGAIGPSQFIPSTWQLYINRLQNILNVYPNPWNPEHAVMGTALLMQDNGAAVGGYTAERNAACKYYSGSSCIPGRVPANSFYGDQVLAHASDFEQQIKFLDEVED